MIKLRRMLKGWGCHMCGLGYITCECNWNSDNKCIFLILERNVICHKDGDASVVKSEETCSCFP